MLLICKQDKPSAGSSTVVGGLRAFPSPTFDPVLYVPAKFVKGHTDAVSNKIVPVHCFLGEKASASLVEYQIMPPM